MIFTIHATRKASVCIALKLRMGDFSDGWYCRASIFVGRQPGSSVTRPAAPVSSCVLLKRRSHCLIRRLVVYHLTARWLTTLNFPYNEQPLWLHVGLIVWHIALRCPLKPEIIQGHMIWKHGNLVCNSRSQMNTIRKLYIRVHASYVICQCPCARMTWKDQHEGLQCNPLNVYV